MNECFQQTQQKCLGISTQVFPENEKSETRSLWKQRQALKDNEMLEDH